MLIRTKFIIIFLAITSIPLLFVGALTFHNYKNSLKTSHISELQNITAFKAYKIEAYFARLKSGIEQNQAGYATKTALPLLNRYAVEPDSPKFIAAEKMIDGPAQNTQKIFGLIDLMLVNPQGRVVYSSNPEHHKKYFLNILPDPEQKAFEEGKSKIYFTDIFQNKETDNKLGMLITAPVSDSNGVFIGVVAFEADISPVYEIIQEATGSSKTGESVLGKKVGNEVLFLSPLKYDPNAALNKSITLGAKIATSIQNAVQGKTGAGLSVDYRGRRVIGTWSYIPSMDWGLATKVDTSEAFADVTNLGNLTIIILVIVFILSGVMAFSIAQSISEPIKQLAKGAAIIGSGNLDYKVGTNLKDEIGQLSWSFDKMTNDLKQITASRDELNKEIAEHKQAEEELRENERRLQYALEAGNFGSWGLDTKTGKAWRSLRHDQIFGYETLLPEWTYKMFLDHVLPEDRKSVDEKFGQAISKNTEWNFECRIQRTDGVVRWITAQGRPILNEQNEVVQITGLVRDITERKQAEEALLKSEIKYRTVADNTYDWELWLDPEGRFIYCSPSCQYITGHKPEEFFTDPGLYAGLIHPDDRPQYERHSREAEHKHGQASESEWRYIRPDGTCCWVAHVCQPVYDDSGQFLGIRGSNRDITNHKKEEEKNRLQNILLQGINRILNTAMTSKTEEELGCICLTIAEEITQSKFGFIGEINSEGRMDDIAISDPGWDTCKAAIPTGHTGYRTVPKGFETRGLYGNILKKGKGFFTNDPKSHPDSTATPEGHPALTAFLGVPLIREDKTIGIVAVGNRDGGYSQEQLELLGALGTAIVQAFIQHRAERTIRQSHDELEKKVEERTVQLTKMVETLVKSEKIIKAERKRFEDVLEMLPAYAVLLTPDYHVAFANCTFRKQFGDDNGKRCYDFLFNRTEPCDNCLTYNVLKTNEPQFWEWTGPDGKIYDIYDYPFTNVDGSALIMEIGVDITAHKQAQEALRSASQYVRSLLETSLDPLLTISPEGKITDVNEATVKVTGISRDKLIDTDFFNYFTEPQKAQEGYREVFTKGFVIDYPLTIRHKDGRLTDVLYNASIYKDTRGNVIGIFAAARDVTEKKRIDAKLEKYRLHLADIVKQRTAELMRSNKDLEQFAYVASHDLQEPLRMIGGYTQLLQRRYKDKLDENANQFIFYTTEAVLRMQQLIDDLLAYSRIKTGEEELQPVDCQAILDDVIKTMQATIEENNAAIKYGSLPTIPVNKGQLFQLFQNLIGNAIKFRRDEPPLINITAKSQDKGWLFSVSDNGIGIEPQYLERIFVIFQRLHTRDKYPGTGIGLAICKKIVERHGGRIWVESQPGKGSTFYFTILTSKGDKNGESSRNWQNS